MLEIEVNNADLPVAVVLGLGGNGLSVVRSLAGTGCDVLILENQKNRCQPHLKTRYGEKIFLEALTGPVLVDFLARRASPTILFPTTDQQVAWLSENRQQLPETCGLMFPSLDVVHKLLDKRRFFIFCREHGFLLPEFCHVDSEDDIVSQIKGMKYPLIIKTPTKVYKPGLDKAYIVNGQQELVNVWGEISSLSDRFLFQEFIPGGDREVYFVLQYISAQGELLASFTGRKIRQWRPGCGGTASCEPAAVPELTELTYNILTKAGFHGIGSMEYKRDPRDGKFYIVEPTVCRTDFQSQIAIANGVNIPMIAFRDAVGLPVKPVIVNGGSKGWMHVMNDRMAAEYYRSKGELTRWQWLFSLRNVRSFDLMSLQDPMPSIVSGWWWMKRQLRKILKSND